MTGLRTRVKFVSPCSNVPKIEFRIGVERLKAEGFEIDVDRRVHQRHLFFAGTVQDRVEALYEAACSPDTEILWSARGGYGATGLLTALDRITEERGKPSPIARSGLPKVLVGYSDVTALHAFVAQRWGWKTIHAPMPGFREFFTLTSKELRAVSELVRNPEAANSWKPPRLKWMTQAPSAPVSGILGGGNLSLWNTLSGTPWEWKPGKDLILFLEDVSEPWAKIERSMQQLAMTQGWKAVRALVLGKFKDCTDGVSLCLKTAPKSWKAPVTPRQLGPSRPRVPDARAMKEIFGSLGECFGIPVAYGLPCGHGGKGAALPLPLGETVELTPEGRLSSTHLVS